MYQLQQYGFSPKKSTDQQITNLQLTLEIMRAQQQDFVVLFIDLKKAFDSARHVDIFNLLMGYNVPKDVIELLWKIYEEDGTVYLINSEKQRPVCNQKGVKQGASTSPLLFNLLIQQIIINFQRQRLGVFIDDVYVGLLAFADDIALICCSYAEA